jgi:hypothetical protein
MAAVGEVWDGVVGVTVGGHHGHKGTEKQEGGGGNTHG